MKGLTADQALPTIELLIKQVSSPIEKQKIENWILGAVESKEKRKDRIRNTLDKKEKYQIKPKSRTKS
ncbi:hypothetical protein [Soonwooa sp.]|uniref:hypothetical protein n=1 Tax=Soonwooa sp. TaxID=1938592 RepID=UPI0028AF4C57|nr:hypothetical protein [Soonwooa sp.]